MKLKLIFLFIFVLTLLFRLFYVSNYNFAFTIDQARDMLEIRKIAIGRDLVFIGPITSLNGVYLGPFWYYFNLPAFVIGAGNPSALVFWQIIWFHLVALIIYVAFKKKNPAFAIISSALFLLSPNLIRAVSYSFNANFLPALVALFLFLLSRTDKKKSKFQFLLLGLLAGLSLQTESAFGILLLPLAIAILLIKRVSLSDFLYLLIGFGITLFPQLAFELKHNFLMTKTFLAEFANKTNILGQHLDFGSKVLDRFRHYLGVLNGSLPLGWLILPLFIAALFWRQGYPVSFGLINILLLVFSLGLYFIYPNKLKDWWTINFTIPFLFILAAFISSVPRKIGLFILLLIVVNAGSFHLTKVKERLETRSDDRALLLNQLETIDWIYGKAKGGGFRVYNYTPAIYDYNYQYLFWWYGGDKYGYQPEKVTYQDGVPEYVESGEKYWKKIRVTDETLLTFLIIEPDERNERFNSWLDQFKNLCLIEEKSFPWPIKVQIRTSCSILK